MFKKVSWKSVCIILFVVITIYFNIKDYYQEIYFSIKNLSIMIIFSFVCYGALYYILQAINLWILTKLQIPNYTLKQAIQNNYITLFINNIFFAATGKLSQIFLFKKQGISIDKATSIVFLDFLNFQIMILIYYSIIFFLNISFYQQNFKYELILAIIGAVICIVVTLFLLFIVLFPKYQKIIINIVQLCLNKLPIKTNNIEKNLNEIFNKFNVSREYLFKQKKIFILITLINFIRLTLLLLIPYFSAKAIGIKLTISDIPSFISLIIFVYLVLSSIPIPGKHGVSESIFTIAFSHILLPYQAATLMIIWRFITYYSNTIIGGIFLIFNKDIKMKDLKEIRKK